MSRSGRAGGALPLAELERVLERACGVALSPGIRLTLADACRRAVRESGLGSDAFLQRLQVEEPAAVALLVEQAVVGETSFYRHREQLDALARLLLAPRPMDRPLSLWSAGCATGEEPYTLAMMLLEAGRGAQAGDRILATDVSARALEAAGAGRYGEWSLRRLDPALRLRFFEPSGRRLTVRPEVRAPVELRRHNLAAEPPPAVGFDVVVCRNVLIYFSAATAAAVLSRLAEAVRPGGWLLLAPVEVPLAAALPLEPVEAPGAVLLRRPEPGRVGGRAEGGVLAAPRRRAHGDPGDARVVPEAEGGAEAPSASAAAAPLSTLEPCCEVATDACRAGFQAAREAGRAGDAAAAERLARQVAERHRCPESYLLVAMAAEARGDDAAAAEALRRALRLEPGLAQAHAALVGVLARLGLPEAAARARRDALEALEPLADEAVLRGVEPLTAGALRQALGDAVPRPARPRHEE